MAHEGAVGWPKGNNCRSSKPCQNSGSIDIVFLASGSEFARLYGGGDGAAGTPSSSRHQHSSSSSAGAQRPMSLPGPASSLGPGEPLDLPPALIPDRCRFAIKPHFNVLIFSPPEIPLNWKKSSFYTLIALDDEIGEFHIENTCNCTLRFLYCLATGDLEIDL